MMIWFFAAPVFAADCSDDVLARAYTRVQVSYVQSDRRSTQKAVRAFTEAAACDPPSAVVVHDLHVAHALDALLAGKPNDAQQHLEVAVAASPTSTLPPSIAADVRVRHAYSMAQETPITWTRSAPYVFDDRTWTVAPNVVRSAPQPVRNKTRSMATALGAVALGLYGGAWAARTTYNRNKGPLADRGDVVPLHRATNVLAVSSAVAGGAAVGLFTVSLVR